MLKLLNRVELEGSDAGDSRHKCSFYQGTVDEQWKAFGWAGGVFRRVETLRKPVLDWWKGIGAVASKAGWADTR